MEVQRRQPEKRVISSMLKGVFMCCGLGLWTVAFVTFQINASHYFTSLSLVPMCVGLGSAMFIRGFYHAWVPVARFSENALYLRPTPLYGCHDVAYSLIDDYVSEDKKLTIHYRDVDDPDGRTGCATIRSHQVGMSALDQMILILRQRVI